MADQNSPNTLILSAKISFLKFVPFLDADYGNVGRAFHAIGRSHGLVSYEIGKMRFRGAIALARSDVQLPPTVKVPIYGPVSIAQLVGQCIIICRGRGSNPRHPTYSPYKVNFSH